MRARLADRTIDMIVLARLEELGEVEEALAGVRLGVLGDQDPDYVERSIDRLIRAGKIRRQVVRRVKPGTNLVDQILTILEPVAAGEVVHAGE